MAQEPSPDALADSPPPDRHGLPEAVPPPPPLEREEKPPPEPEMEVTDTGLGIVELVQGEGAEAVDGAEVAVHYVGKLEDGKIFDSSRERGVPFRFELGSELVIPAWEEGVLGMKVGGKRRLIVPPHLAYGERGHGAVPGGAILEFEIELLEVEPPD